MKYGSRNRTRAVFEDAVCFVAVALGVLVSIALVTWALFAIERVLVGVMLVSPIALLMLVGRVTRDRALDDWDANRSRPMVVRFARAFAIGFAWPLWVGHHTAP